MSMGDVIFLIVETVAAVAIVLLIEWNKRRLERRFWAGTRRKRGNQ